MSMEGGNFLEAVHDAYTVSGQRPEKIELVGFGTDIVLRLGFEDTPTPHTKRQTGLLLGKLGRRYSAYEWGAVIYSCRNEMRFHARLVRRGLSPGL